MKKGFTVVEGMIVLVIIGLLAAIAIPAFMKDRENTLRRKLGLPDKPAYESYKSEEELRAMAAEMKSSMLLEEEDWVPPPQQPPRFQSKIINIQGVISVVRDNLTGREYFLTEGYGMYEINPQPTLVEGP